jgi:malate dehydrogenase (oxaloacetate-decarboxylating)
MPVMEGKALLFKEFADVDAFPICLDTKDVDEIIRTVKYLAPTFGGINLEDISAPRCFEIERRLKAELDIPVFHDDQHGTAIVVCAGLLNALKLVGKQMENVNIVINGAGSAGISIAKLLMLFGAGNIVLVDKHGAVSVEEEWLNPAQRQMAEVTNKHHERGPLSEVIRGKDVFIGVSAPKVVTAEMVATMAENAIVFAMANPTPEIMPEEAAKGGARVIATGRSDYPNQINNVLVFPGIFRGALDARAIDITEEMKVTAARAIAAIVTDEELREDYIIPGAFDKRVAPAVANAVMECAKREGVSKLK